MDATGHRRWRWALLVAFVAGALLRLWNLRNQVLMGDELHAVRSALAWELPRILTTYRLADNSIPLTGFFRLLVESGVVLREPILRLPSLSAGLGLLIALPWFVDRELGGRAAIGVGWLAAVSPTLVYYARNSRPYAVIVLLCLVAVAAFWQWWVRRGRWGWALLYCLAGAGAAWFHLGAAPIVAAPLVFAGLEVGRDLARRTPEGLTGVRRLLGPAIGLLGLIALFLVPALATFLRLVRERPGESLPTPESVLGTLALQAGTGRPWLAVLFWGMALTGLWFLARERPRLAAYSGCLVGVQWIAIALVLRPTGLEHVIVLNRYLLVTLPIVLAWVAFGVDRAARPVRRFGLQARELAPALLLLVLVAGGPYPAQPGLQFGPFAGSNAAANFLAGPVEVPEGRIPAVYVMLAREPGRAAVLEAPRNPAWWQNRGPLVYSLVHGRSVVIGSYDPTLPEPRLRLRTLVPLDPSRMARSGARFVIVSLDARDPTEVASSPGPPRRSRQWAEARRLTRRLEEEWGEPAWVEGSLRVWDLANLRSTPDAPGSDD